MLRQSRSADSEDDVSVLSSMSSTLNHVRDYGISYTTSRNRTTGPSKAGGLVDVADTSLVVPERLCLLFTIVSFGYMCAWTSLGSLISYYKHTYSSALYNNIYCSFYLFGLPVSILQYKYDTEMDHIWGSKKAYLLKGAFGFGLIILVLLVLPFVKSTTGLVVLYSILGICSWLIHGAATLLVSVFPPRASGYLQTGFRSPEIFTVLAVSTFDIAADASTASLNYFYLSIAVMVSLGWIAWYHIVDSRATEHLFLDIDKANEELYWLDANADLQLTLGQGDEDGVLSNHNSPFVYGSIGGSGFQTSDDISEDAADYDGDEEYGGGVFESSPLLKETSRGSSGLSTSFHGTPMQSYSSSSSTRSHTHTHNMGRHTRARMHTLGGVDDEPYPSGRAADFSHHSSSPASNPNPFDTPSNVGRKEARDRENRDASSTVIERNTGFQKYSKMEVSKAIRPLCLALFLVMFTSIFQASFFSYADSTVTDIDLEQRLYFTRLFLDLAGRPLATLLPRPWFVKTPIMVFKLSVWRLLLFFIYFLYIFLPGFPQNDNFVVFIVGIFSLANGYFSVLIYEYASHDTSHLGKNAQTYSASLLNIVFQISAFVSVSASTAIIWYFDRV